MIPASPVFRKDRKERKERKRFYGYRTFANLDAGWLGDKQYRAVFAVFVVFAVFAVIFAHIEFLRTRMGADCSIPFLML